MAKQQKFKPTENASSSEHAIMKSEMTSEQAGLTPTTMTRPNRPTELGYWHDDDGLINGDYTQQQQQQQQEDSN